MLSDANWNMFSVHAFHSQFNTFSYHGLNFGYQTSHTVLHISFTFLGYWKKLIFTINFYNFCIWVFSFLIKSRIFKKKGRSSSWLFFRISELSATLRCFNVIIKKNDTEIKATNSRTVQTIFWFEYYFTICHKPIWWLTRQYSLIQITTNKKYYEVMLIAQIFLSFTICL